MKRQLQESTAISESIKVDIKHLAEKTEKLQWLKRAKLEDYLVAVLRGAEYQTDYMYHRYFDAELPANEDPLLAASMLQTLYLPELDAQHALFLKAVGAFRAWVAEGMQQRLDILRATNLKSAPNKDHCDQFTTYLTKLNECVALVEQAAKELARELNKV